MSYSDINICNIALSHLGDVAAVASISAPSTQQEKWCATYYPLARDMALSDRSWSFNTVRSTLVTSSVTPPTTWQYAYDVPTGTINFIGLLDPNAIDDYTSPVNYVTLGLQTAPVANLGIRSPYPFVIEWDSASSKQVIYTNLASAVGRYTLAVTDPTKWPVSFIDAVAYLLASYLAGPLLKGDAGTAKGEAMRKMYEQMALPNASESDASGRQVEINSGAAWIVGRG